MYQALFSFIAGLGAAQGMLMGLLLWTRPVNHDANRWLSALTLVFSAVTAGDILNTTHAVLQVPHLAWVFDWMVLLIGPLFYAYTLVATENRLPGKWGMSLHALPAVLMLLLLLPLFSLSSAEKVAAIQKDYEEDLRANYLVVIAVAQTLAYLLASCWKVIQFNQRLKDYFSNFGQMKLDWLLKLLLLNAALWLFWLLSVMQGAAFDGLLKLGIALVVYTLAFAGFRQPALFSHALVNVKRSEATSDLDNTADSLTLPVHTELPDSGRTSEAPNPEQIYPPVSTDSEKYTKSSLTEELKTQYRQRLEQHMAIEKPFLDNALTLNDLADQIAISSHHLSQILNGVLGVNFYDFVNGYRVDEVKRCMRDSAYSNQTILEIAFASGFNSKATFNSVFKKHTASTPSRYRAKPD